LETTAVGADAAQASPGPAPGGAASAADGARPRSEDVDAELSELPSGPDLQALTRKEWMDRLEHRIQLERQRDEAPMVRLSPPEHDEATTVASRSWLDLLCCRGQAASEPDPAKRRGGSSPPSWYQRTFCCHRAGIESGVPTPPAEDEEEQEGNNVRTSGSASHETDQLEQEASLGQRLWKMSVPAALFHASLPASSCSHAPCSAEGSGRALRRVKTDARGSGSPYSPRSPGPVRWFFLSIFRSTSTF
jgi:hypothetical protein